MQKLSFGQDCVYFDGAEPTNRPMLAKVLVVAQDGAVCDLTVFPPINGPVMLKVNVRHCDDQHYAEFPQQKRYGGFLTYEEHASKTAKRIKAKQESEARREKAEREQPVSPLKIPGVDQNETAAQTIERLHGLGKIPAFVCEIVDNPEWPLDRVQSYMNELDSLLKEDKKPKKREREPALA